MAVLFVPAVDGVGVTAVMDISGCNFVNVVVEDDDVVVVVGVVLVVGGTEREAGPPPPGKTVNVTLPELNGVVMGPETRMNRRI